MMTLLHDRNGNPRSVRWWASVIAIAAGSATFLVTFLGLWNAAGLPIVATTAHVEARLRPIVETIRQIRHNINDVSLEQAYARQSSNTEDLSKWQIELQKTTDPTLHAMIEARITELNRERAVIEQRIKHLQDTDVRTDR